MKDISACLLYMGGGSGKGAKHLVVALFLDGEELMPEALRGHDVAIAGVPAELKWECQWISPQKLQGQGLKF